MPPVRMTRAEYEATYGAKPVVSTSTLDTTPAPIRMTRAEYEATYGPQKQENRLTRTIKDIPSDFLEMGGGVIDAVKRGGENIATAFTKEGLTIPQRATGALVAAPSAVVNVAGEAGLGAAKLFTTDEFEKAVSSKLSELGEAAMNTGVGKSLAGFYERLPEDQKYTLTNIIAPAANVLSSGPIGAGGAKVTKAIGEAIPSATDKIGEVAATFAKNQDEKAISNVVSEIAKVEDKYAPTRKANEYAKDLDASRKRIAQSNVLENAVDENGLLRTTDAVVAYRSKTIDGVEDVVRKNLESEAKTINLAEIRNEMKLALADSGLEGGDLITALNGIEREIKGLSLRADELGNIPLVKLQDAKIGTTRNINFNTPPETATYRKAIARTYKELIENKSDTNVREVNNELAKYYRDIERLERLDGKRVEGGRLGKYTAALTGTALGSMAGSVGGGLGAAFGGIAGGEVAAVIKGASMAGKFKKGVRGNVPENQILKDAKARAEAGKVVDLKQPDKKVGAPKNVPKTKEIQKIEGQIAKNVQMQKTAIKAGDFTLVKALKEVYEILVEKLREQVRFVRENYKDKGGYVSLTGQSTPRKRIQAKATSAPTKAQSISDTVTPEEKLSIAKELENYDATPMTVNGKIEMSDSDVEFRISELQDKNAKGTFTDEDALEARKLLEKKGISFEDTALLAEAKKYKSAEEFVKAKTDPLYEFNNYKTIEDKDIARGTVKEAINDIGGINNVNRGTVNISDLITTENVNMSSERARQVINEVKSGTKTPLVINEYGEILDGHHRLNAYRELGIREIPVIAPKGTEFVRPVSKSQLTDIWKQANVK